MELFNLLRAMGGVKAGQEGELSNLPKGTTLLAHILESDQQGHTTLKIGQHFLKTTLSQWVEPGREVKLMVSENSPRLVLQLMPESEWPLPTPGEKPTALASSIKPPQPSNPGPVHYFKARILELTSDGGIRVKITMPPAASQQGPDRPGHGSPRLSAGKEITARLSVQGPEPDLKPGSEMGFIVKQTSPRMVLQLVDPGPQPRTNVASVISGLMVEPDRFAQAARDALALMDQIRPPSENLRERIDTLTQLITRLAPAEKDADTMFPGRLMDILGFRGNRVPIQEATARLWTEILKTQNMDRRPNAKTWHALLEASAKLYDGVEQLQTLGHETSRNLDTLLLAFPIFWPGGEGRGELILKKEEHPENKSDSRTYRITLLLDLTGLGPIKVDLEVQGKEVGGAIWTTAGPVHDAVSDALGHLTNSLEALGFKVKGFSANVFTPAEPPPQTMAGSILPRGEGLINLKV